MPPNKDLCDRPNVKSRYYPTFDLVFFSVLLPLSLCVCCYVLRKLWVGKRNAMTLPTTVFVLIALFNEIHGAYKFVFRYVLLKHSSIPVAFCSAIMSVGLFATLAAYISLQQVLVRRLKVVFDGGLHAVNGWVIASWNAAHISALLIFAVFLSIRASHIDCHYQLRFKGLAVDIGVFPRKALFCSTDARYDYLVLTPIIVFSFFVFFGNFSLIWMYTRRLHHAFAVDCSDLPESEQNNADAANKVVRKSMVVAFASILSTLLATVALVSGIRQIYYADILLNVVFLFSLFALGQHWYDATLTHCEWLVEWCLAKYTAHGKAQTAKKHIGTELSLQRVKSLSQPSSARSSSEKVL